MKLIIFLMIFSLPSLAQDLVLKKGSFAFIKVQPGEKIKVTNYHAIKVIDHSSKIKVIAKKPGHAKITTAKKIYRVAVINDKNYQTYIKLKESLKQVRGLKLSIEKKEVLVQGNILRLKDLISLSQTYKTNPFSMELSIHRDIFSLLTNHIKTAIKQNRLPDIRIDESMTAHISQKYKSYKESYKRLLHPYGLKILWSQNILGPRPLVQINVTIAEVSHSSQRQLGLELENNYQAQLLPSLQQGHALTALLKALEERGQAKVLARPSLLAESGGTAQFLAGGELPFRVAGYQTSQITWKQHGIILNIEPHADLNNNIRLKIKTEISLVDTSVQVDGLPGFKTNRINSEFNTNDGKTIVLSGLIRKQKGQSEKSIPLLSQIPILGPLFKSRHFLENKSELMVFVEAQLAAQEQNLPQTKSQLMESFNETF